MNTTIKLKTKLSVVLLALFLVFSCMFVKLPSAVSTSPEVIDSYFQDGVETWYIKWGYYPHSAAYYMAVGQTFRTPNGTAHTLSSAAFNMSKTGNPTGQLVAQLYEISGYYGTNALPTGPALATSSIMLCTSLPTSYTLCTFTFNSTYVMQPNHYYFIGVFPVSIGGIDSSNYVRLAYDSNAGSPPAHSGNMAYYRAGTWDYLNTNGDFCFTVYGTPVGVTFSTLSTSSYESGTMTNMTFHAEKLVNNLDHYVFSWNISGSYIDDDSASFSDTSACDVTVSKLISSVPLGTVISWYVTGYDTNGISTTSNIQSFTVQATVTFYINDGGTLERNGMPIASGTTTTYTTPTTLTMAAVPENSSYLFQSFNWTNPEGSSLANSYAFTVVNQSTFSATMSQPTAIHCTCWNEGYAAGYAQGFADAQS